MGRDRRGLVAMQQASLVVAARRRSGETSVVAVVVHGRVSTLGADRVEERDEHALFHELVDLGHGLVECRRVRWGVGLGEGQKVVTDLSREVDLGGG
jgi:hypothetical protein